MSELQPTNLKLFNQSTHYYRLQVNVGSYTVSSNEESSEFNEHFRTPDDAKFEGKVVEAVACLGNQHAGATVRDLIKILRSGKNIDQTTLAEYSMFTIGDFVVITKDEAILAINGDITRRTREEGFDITRGQK
jgi:hypothetical protein